MPVKILSYHANQIRKTTLVSLVFSNKDLRICQITFFLYMHRYIYYVQLFVDYWKSYLKRLKAHDSGFCCVCYMRSITLCACFHGNSTIATKLMECCRENSIMTTAICRYPYEIGLVYI